MNPIVRMTLALVILGVAAASFTADLTIKQCDSRGCIPVQKRVALDATSNGTEKLIHANGTSLKLAYGGPVLGGPRVYLVEKEGVNKNHVFMLKNQEFTFDVELSSMKCGFNAALYFVGMTENQGGAEAGTGYCDAQAVGGTLCSEMDILEANTVAQQYTTHACIDACASNSGNPQCKSTFGQPSAKCDQSGCGLNPFRYGPGTTYDKENNNLEWYGPGSSYKLDSTQPFTVVTQFHAEGSELTSIARFYIQNGNKIQLPTLYVRTPTDGHHYGAYNEPSITKDYCTDIYDRWNGGASYAPLAQMGKNMESGMVLAMSAWYAKETYPLTPGEQQTGMSWLDGYNHWTSDHNTKVGPCTQTTSDAGGPYSATFSNIRIGAIGTTTGGSPTPPMPPPPPSGCPGGSLSACIALCPSDPPVVYKACVTSCAKRCTGLSVRTEVSLPFIASQK